MVLTSIKAKKEKFGDYSGELSIFYKTLTSSYLGLEIYKTVPEQIKLQLFECVLDALTK